MKVITILHDAFEGMHGVVRIVLFVHLSIVCRLSYDGRMKGRATINTCCCIIDWRVDIDPAILLLDSLPCDELPLCLVVLL